MKTMEALAIEFSAIKAVFEKISFDKDVTTSITVGKDHAVLEAGLDGLMVPVARITVGTLLVKSLAPPHIKLEAHISTPAFNLHLDEMRVRESIIHRMIDAVGYLETFHLCKSFPIDFTED